MEWILIWSTLLIGLGSSISHSGSCHGRGCRGGRGRFADACHDGAHNLDDDDKADKHHEYRDEAHGDDL